MTIKAGQTFHRGEKHVELRKDQQQQNSEEGMSKLPKVKTERLPKRDAVVRLRAVYACLERGWQECQTAEQQTVSKPNPEEGS